MKEKEVKKEEEDVVVDIPILVRAVCSTAQDGVPFLVTLSCCCSHAASISIIQSLMSSHFMLHHCVNYAFFNYVHSASMKNVIMTFDIKDTIILVSQCLHYDINTLNYVLFQVHRTKFLHSYKENN